MITRAPLHEQLLASVHDGPFDAHARWAADLLGAPIGLVTVLDDGRQHFAGMHGLDGPVAVDRSTPISQSLCAIVTDEGRPLAMEDGRRHRWLRTHAAVRGLGIRAYLGLPLRLPDGSRIGAVCVADVRARRWGAAHHGALTRVRDLVEAELADRVDADPSA